MHTEFGRLLHHHIHFVTPGDALHQPDFQGRFDIPATALANSQADLLFCHDAKSGHKLATAAVEQCQSIARLEPQYATDIARLVTPQHKVCGVTSPAKKNSSRGCS